MTTTTEKWPGRIALMVAHCAGMVDLVALPVWVGTLISAYGFDPQQAGGLATLFLVGAVVSSLYLAPRFNRLNRKLVAVSGFATAGIAFALASLQTIVDNGGDPVTGPVVLPPPAGGTRIRFVDIPPDTEELLSEGAGKMASAFSEIGDVAASTVNETSPHPLMHRTESIDYGIVIEGELTLVLDEGEALLKPGSVVIQRGTNHAWANRSGKACRMLFVLIDGRYSPQIEALLEQH